MSNDKTLKEYILDKERFILEVKHDDDLILQSKYELAQILYSIGRYEESICHLSEVFDMCF